MTLVHALVTAKTWDEVAEAIEARDQRRELQYGDIVSHYRGEDRAGDDMEVTIWHNLRRAAVRQCNGDSEWGDWNEAEQTILLDDPDENGLPRKVDHNGRQLAPSSGV